MRRGRASRERVDIWPGFVDALSTLLLVTMFLLVVFVLAQFFLGQLLQGRNVTVERLQSQLAEARRELAQERRTVTDLRLGLEQAQTDLRALRAEKADVEAQLSDAQAERDMLDRRLARAESNRRALEQSLADASREQQRLQGEVRLRENQIRQLAALVDQLESRKTAAEQGAKKSREQLETLRAQLRTLTRQLSQVTAALDAREAEITRQSARIAELGNRLNLALASKVEELSRYRSDFFGRLRQVLGDRPDIRVVGDRFVFQSEVLFRTGEAEIGEQGRRELKKFVDAFKEIMPEIPSDLPWVLQIDGHTDKRPIHTARFPSNWELSTARAIAVANFLIENGIPPERVAARGFAEFQPLDPGDSEEAYRRNRRIEIKLTTR